MRGFLAMVRKELAHVRRDRRLIGYVAGLPLILIVLFGSALHLKVDNLTAAVWDQDRTFFSLQVKDRLQSQGGLKVVEVDSEERIRELLRGGGAQLGFVIPAGFSRRVADNEESTFDLFIDATMPAVAQAAMYGARVLESHDLAAELGLDDDGTVRGPSIKVKEIALFNPRLRDADFFLPGALGFIIMLVCLTLSTGFIREREQGTIEQLWVTPISRIGLVAGKIVPYAFIAFADFVTVCVLAYVVFDLPFRASLLSVALLAGLLIVSILALGTLTSTIVQNQLQATFANVSISMVSLLLSGFIFPRESMPGWAQSVSAALPVTYFMKAIRSLLLKGVSASEIAPDYAALAAFAIAFNLLSVLLLRKRVT
jgi:ABC-2 type transport system permease protein